MYEAHCSKKYCRNKFMANGFGYRPQSCADHLPEARAIRAAQYERGFTEKQVATVFDLYNSSPWYAEKLLDLCEALDLVPHTGDSTGCIHKLRKPTHARSGSDCYTIRSCDYPLDHLVWLRGAGAATSRRAPWVLLTQPYHEFSGEEELPEWADRVAYIDSPYEQGTPMHAALLWHSEGGYQR